MKSLRVVSYAINGRGMGHLVRQLSILRWVRRIAAFLDIKAECWVLTSSEADTLARREGFPAFKMPSKAMLRDAGIEPSRYLSLARAWTLNIVSGLQPDVLIVDTFPGGSFGELLSVLEMVPHRVLVARKVREQVEADPGFAALLPLYAHHVVPDARGTGPILCREREELATREEARAVFGIDESRRAVYLTLGCGGDPAARDALPTLAREIAATGRHVVVGAGPLYTGREFRGDGISWQSRYVPMELYPAFDAAVSAGGYNTFHELMYCGVPTVFLPQPRISDDQDERARRAEAAGAGRVASSVDEVIALLEDPGCSARARALVATNGAKAAALSVLKGVLADSDLALADRVLSHDLLARAQRVGGGDGTARILEVVRILSGGTGAERASRQRLLSELSERGVDVGDLVTELGAEEPMDAFLGAVQRHDVPFDAAVTLLRALRRKFPAATSSCLGEASQRLFATWARFQDWMGAVSLMRAVPVQRSYGVTGFAADVVRWLDGEEDLFDALRRFAQLEGGGARPVAETLRLLCHEQESGAEQPEQVAG